MPLLSGSGKGIVGENIRELMKTGRSQAQAVAIAMKKAGKAKAPSVKPKAFKAPKEDDGEVDGL